VDTGSGPVVRYVIQIEAETLIWDISFVAAPASSFIDHPRQTEGGSAITIEWKAVYSERRSSWERSRLQSIKPDPRLSIHGSVVRGPARAMVPGLLLHRFPKTHKIRIYCSPLWFGGSAGSWYPLSIIIHQCSFGTHNWQFTPRLHHSGMFPVSVLQEWSHSIPAYTHWISGNSTILQSSASYRMATT